MRGGIHAYSLLPQAWIQVFFVSLFPLDLLVAPWPGSCAGRASGWWPTYGAGRRRELDRELAVAG